MVVIMVSLVNLSEWWPSGLDRSNVRRTQQTIIYRQRKKMIGVAQWLPKLATEQGKHRAGGGLFGALQQLSRRKQACVMQGSSVVSMRSDVNLGKTDSKRMHSIFTPLHAHTHTHQQLVQSEAIQLTA